MEPICPHCKQHYPPGYSEALRKKRSESAKAAFRRSPEKYGARRKADYQEIYKLRDQGLSKPAIAKILNCGRGSVDHALRIRKAIDATC